MIGYAANLPQSEHLLTPFLIRNVGLTLNDSCLDERVACRAST
jgi:hypothetical protein